MSEAPQYADLAYEKLLSGFDADPEHYAADRQADILNGKPTWLFMDQTPTAGRFQYFVNTHLAAQIDYNYLYPGQITVCTPEVMYFPSDEEGIDRRAILRPRKTRLESLAAAVAIVESRDKTNSY